VNEFKVNELSNRLEKNYSGILFDVMRSMGNSGVF